MPTEYHYYATSLSTWKTDTDLFKLMKVMNEDTLPYVIFLVPVNINAEYMIKYFAPMVKDSIVIFESEDIKKYKIIDK